MNEANQVILAIAGMLTGVTIFIAVLLAYLHVRKSAPPAVALSPELAARLLAQMETLQGSVDAMAIETERISEGQRFTTRLLSERHAEKADPSLRSG